MAAALGPIASTSARAPNFEVEAHSLISSAVSTLGPMQAARCFSSSARSLLAPIGQLSRPASSPCFPILGRAADPAQSELRYRVGRMPRPSCVTSRTLTSAPSGARAIPRARLISQARRPRQDDLDGRDHQDPGRLGRRQVHGLCLDRPSARGARARHHDQHRLRRVPDAVRPARTLARADRHRKRHYSHVDCPGHADYARRPSRSPRLTAADQEHDHWRGDYGCASRLRWPS